MRRGETPQDIVHTKGFCEFENNRRKARFFDMETKRFSGYWRGIIPPQYILSHRRFKCVVLNPPDFNPGSWIGAGKILVDYNSKEFVLTARPRKVEGDVRGYAAEIYRSKDAERFELIHSISKEEAASKSALKIHSIEGNQLLKDPSTDKWYFYLSVDIGREFVWGGSYWETLLMTSDSLEGPWESKGLVLKRGTTYDANQARDASIDIVDGRYFCLYKATDREHRTQAALATSSNGIEWYKHGPFTIDGKTQPPYVLLSGTLFAGTDAPIFMGFDGRGHVDNPRYRRIAVANTFSAYKLDYRNMNLETVFTAPWEALSQYEHERYPAHSYMTLAYDPFKKRMLIYTEAIDPKLTKEIGLNSDVERVILFEVPL